MVTKAVEAAYKCTITPLRPQVLTLHEAPENRTPPLVHGFGFFGAARDTLLAAVRRYCERCVRARARSRIIYYYTAIDLQRIVPPSMRNCTGAVRGRSSFCSHELSQLFRALNTRTRAARLGAITNGLTRSSLSLQTLHNLVLTWYIGIYRIIDIRAADRPTVKLGVIYKHIL